jgi:hypothetical protein
MIRHVLTNGTFYADLGPDHHHRRSSRQQTRRLVRRLEQPGYAVEITPVPQAA